MIRNIITINADLCDGCGLCALKCAEGELRILDGKARLVSEVYCDGLGACIGECPRGAITIGPREAPAFNEEAAQNHLDQRDRESNSRTEPIPRGCPGASVRIMSAPASHRSAPEDRSAASSELTHWPVQLALVPEHAPFLRGADILICADCVPFALPDFHAGYLKNRAVLVGCPKLDNLGYYREKLSDIFRASSPQSVTLLRMEVPCCGGIARAAVNARDEALPEMPIDIVTVGISGSVSRERVPPLRERQACREDSIEVQP
jgi:ferredoxin